MTTIAILPVPNEQGGVAYRAVAGNKQSEGTTAGAALDALSEQLAEGEKGTLAVVQIGRPDQFFDATCQQRLVTLMARWRTARDRGDVLLTLMARWRTARDRGDVLPAAEQAELDALVESEIRAAAARAAVLADELGR